MVSFPPIRPGEPVKVSATAYMAFRRCPAQALARYQGRYPPESKASFRGGITHGLIARHLQDGPIADPAQAAREVIGNSSLNHKINAAGLGRPSVLRLVIAEAVDLYARFCRLPLDAYREAEVNLEHDPAPGVTLVGKVDAVFEGPLLRDWKTGPLGEPFAQLLFYALIWSLREGELPKVEAISLQTGETSSRDTEETDLIEIAGYVADLVNLVRMNFESEGFVAERRAGPWCRHCPLKDECPEGLKALAVNQ